MKQGNYNKKGNADQTAGEALVSASTASSSEFVTPFMTAFAYHQFFNATPRINVCLKRCE